tara:strand:+ start:120 stop:326 length:207 start_codon:yes stop_codon:yes gene_type:complete
MTDPEAQERYWSDAVKRTEQMLDEVYARLRATHGTPYFNALAARFILFSLYFCPDAASISSSRPPCTH